MIDKAQAVEIVNDIISGYHQPDGDECIILDAETIGKEWGWVFFYTSKKWQKTNDIKDAMAGNAPLIVLRENGKVIVTGTVQPIEYYIDRFEAMADSVVNKI